MCLNCPIGYSSDVGSTKCRTCDAGMFKDQAIGKDCLNCKSGQYRTTEDVDSTTCIACPSGFSQKQGGQTSCLPCIPGEYQNETKQTSCMPCSHNTKSTRPNSTKCDVCGEGEKSEPGSARCTKCDAGEAGTPCQPCAKGLYRNATMSPKMCLNCPAGYSSDIGSTKCRPCEGGTFSNQIGNDCQDCSIGKFRPSGTKSVTTCNKCPEGYSSDVGSTKCRKNPTPSF